MGKVPTIRLGTVPEITAQMLYYDVCHGRRGWPPATIRKRCWTVGPATRRSRPHANCAAVCLSRTRSMAQTRLVEPFTPSSSVRQISSPKCLGKQMTIPNRV